MDIYTGVEKQAPPNLTPIQALLNSLFNRDHGFQFSIPGPDGTKAPGVMYGMRFKNEEMDMKKEKEESKPIVRDSTLGGDNYGLQGLANRIAARTPEPSTGTVHNFAAGGMVPSADGSVDASQLPQLSDTVTSLNKAPDTNYDFYKDLSSEDRQALQQKLIQQQTSAPNMIASGAAGIGDAISNSFGGKNTSFQKDLTANNQATQDRALAGFDTARAQKMQDMQGNQEMMMNDPKSPLSTSMRAILKTQGVNVPSGMNAALAMKALGPLGELAMKQATLQQQRDLQQQSINIAKQGQETKKEEVGFEQDKEAAKHWLLDPKGAADARERISRGSQNPVASLPKPGSSMKHPSGAIVTRIN
jgi:hypothetical protein